MTKDIKDNIFATTIANNELTLTEKAVALAAVLESTQGIKDFEEFADHLKARFKQSSQDIINSLDLSTSSLSRDFMIAAQAAVEAPQDLANVAGASGKLLAALAEKGGFINNMLSANFDLQDAYDVLRSALLRARKFDTFDELKVITKQLGQQFDHLKIFKESNDDLIRNVCSVAADVTSDQRFAPKAPAAKKHM